MLTKADIGCMSDVHITSDGKYEMVYSVKTSNKVYRLDLQQPIQETLRLPSFDHRVRRFPEIETDSKEWTSFTFLNDVLYATSAEKYGADGDDVYGHTVWRYDTDKFVRVAVLGICSLPDLTLARDGARQSLALSNGRFYTFNRDAQTLYRWSNDLQDLLSQEIKYRQPLNAIVKLYNTGEVVVMDGPQLHFQTQTGISSVLDEKTVVVLPATSSYVVSQNGMYLLQRSPLWTVGLRILHTPEFAAYCAADPTARLERVYQRIKDRCVQYPEDPRCVCMDEDQLMTSRGYDAFNAEARSTLKTRVGCIVESCTQARESNPGDLFSMYMNRYNCTSNELKICNSILNLNNSSTADVELRNACGDPSNPPGTTDPSAKDPSAKDPSSTDTPSTDPPSTDPSSIWSTELIVGIVVAIALLLMIVGYMYFKRRDAPPPTTE